MLNSIVYAINVLKALNTLSSNEYLNEWKQPKDPSEVETVIPWDWYWDEEPVDAAAAAAPSWFLSFDDLHCCVVNGFQSFVEPNQLSLLGRGCFHFCRCSLGCATCWDSDHLKD
jgi:hypothetical protein